MKKIKVAPTTTSPNWDASMAIDAFCEGNITDDMDLFELLRLRDADGQSVFMSLI